MYYIKTWLKLKHFSFIKELDDIGRYEFYKGSKSILYELPEKISKALEIKELLTI